MKSYSGMAYTRLPRAGSWLASPSSSPSFISMPSGAFSMASMNWWPWMRGRKKLLGPSCSVSGVPKSQWSVKQTSVTPRLSSARAISAMRALLSASKEQLLCTW